MNQIETVIRVEVNGRQYEVVPHTQLYEDIRMNASWEDEYHIGNNLRPSQKTS